jgi:hypothetical protein
MVDGCWLPPTRILLSARRHIEGESAMIVNSRYTIPVHPMAATKDELTPYEKPSTVSISGGDH